jgi:dihydropyrimidinase
VIDYAELVDAEVYIVHMSCSGAADAVRDARRRGLRVWGETRPIYLGLTRDAYAKGGIEAAKVSRRP